MGYRSRIRKVFSSHKSYVRKKKRQIPQRLKAAGLAPHLVELLQKHEQKAKTQADAAQKKSPEKDQQNAAVQQKQAVALKKQTDQKFGKQKQSLMDSIRGFKKKDLSDVKKRKLKDRKKEVSTVSQILAFNRGKMRKASERVLRPKKKEKRTVLGDIKRGKKLKKVFQKETTRKDHLRRLRKDKAYYKANFDFRRAKYKKRK